MTTAAGMDFTREIEAPAGAFGESGAECTARLEARWARMQAAERAAAAEAQAQVKRRLEVVADSTFRDLALALGEVESESGWVVLAERVDALEQDGALSDRQAAELRARLERVARSRGWVRDDG